MKKLVTALGAAALVVAAAVPAAAMNNGISGVTDGSSAFITNSKVKTFVDTTMSNLSVSNIFSGSNTVVATTNTGGNYFEAESDIENSSTTTGEAVAAVEGNTEANMVMADTTETVDQSTEGATGENLVMDVSDDSNVSITNDDTEEKATASVVTEAVVQAGEQHDAAVVGADSGNNGVVANDITGVTQVTGASGVAVKFTKTLNFADFFKVFTKNK